MVKRIFVPLLSIFVFSLTSCRINDPEPSKEQYQVTFDANGGELDGEAVITVNGGALFKDIVKPTFKKAGYDFSYFSFDTKGDEIIAQDYIIVSDVTVFAQYDIASIELTFDPNGGTLTGNNHLAVDYGTKFSDVIPPIAEKESAQFSYWSLDKAGEEKVNQDYEFIIDTMLYAQYIDFPCDITFDPNGGTLSSPTNILTVGRGTIFGEIENVPTATYLDQVFVGWFLDEDLNNPVTMSYKIMDNVTFFAKYSNSMVDIVFNQLDGELIGDNQISIPQGTAFGQIEKDKIPTCVRANYVFSGWSLSDTSGVVISDNYIFNNGVTLFAIYALDEVTVTFDSNGADTDSSSTKVLRNITFGEILCPTMVKTGYHFIRWTFDREGYGIIDDDYVISDNLTVYAQFEIDIVKISFDAMGGTLKDFEGEYIEVDYGTLVSQISLPQCEKEDYNFLFWSLSPDNPSKIDDSYSISKHETFYAIYEIKKVKIIFHLGVSHQVVENVDIKTKWSDIDKPEPPQQIGFDFKGWSKRADGYHPFNDDDVFIKDTTVYPYYVIAKMTITFNSNGGILFGDNTIDVDYGTKFNDVSTPTVTPPLFSQKTFSGWSLDTTKENIIDGDYLITADITLYAIFEDTKEFTLIFNPNGGDIKSGSAIVTISDGTLWKNIPKPVVEKEDYVFKYWTYDLEGSQIIKDDDSFSFSISKTIYAQYDLEQLIITFDPNGGEITSGSSTANVPYGNLWGTVSKPTVVHPSGFAFIGWSITKSKDVGMLTDDSVVDQSRTVYAIYDNTVTITFDANGGQLTGSNVCDIVVGEPFSTLFLKKPIASKSGYRFQYWAYDQSGNNKVNDTDTFTADTTLYATYIQRFTVSFDPGEGSFNDSQTHTFTVDKGTVLNAITGYKEPTLANANFLGWSTTQSRDDIIPKTTVVNANLNLYAIYEAIDSLNIVDPGESVINAYQSIAIQYENELSTDVTASVSAGLSDYFRVEVDEARDLVYVDNIAGPFSGDVTVTLTNGEISKTVTFTVKKPSNRLELSEAVDFALMHQNGDGYSYINIELDGYSVEESYPDFWNDSIEGRGGVYAYNDSGWVVGSTHITGFVVANEEMASKSIDISDPSDVSHHSYYYENLTNANFENRYTKKTTRLDDEFYVDKVNKRMIVHNSENLFVAMERGYRPVFVDSEIAVTNSVAHRAYQVYQKAREWCFDAYGDELTTDFEKARQLFEYLVNKTHYDHWITSDAFKEEYPEEFSLNWSSYFSEGVFLNKGISVCDGMSKAYTIMARIEGLAVVRQAAFSSETNTGHAWNLFEYNDEWYLLCPTNAHQTVSGLSEALGYQASFMYYDYFMASGHYFDSTYDDQRFFTNLTLSSSPLDVLSMDYFTEGQSYNLTSSAMANQLGIALPEFNNNTCVSYTSSDSFAANIMQSYNNYHSFKFASAYETASQVSNLRIALFVC